jgi:hypothetical protein
MALTLSKTGITDGQTIEVGHVTQSVDALTGQIPAGILTTYQGRRMWVKKTKDDLDYLYIGRHNDTLLWKQLIWF